MYILSLDEFGKENKKVGGKAANLGEMVRIGLPVPPGFVVTTDAYDMFLTETKIADKIDSLLSGLDADDTKKLKEISEKIENLIINSEMPGDIASEIKNKYEELSVGKEVKKLGGPVLDMIGLAKEAYVAVRSSATAEDLENASFAGQMKTFLNVRTFYNLEKAIKACWASLFTPRAIFYRAKKGVTDTPSIGVIVQKMIDSNKAGVMFTADPVANDASKILIEASWGLGEAIVSGLVRPDEYVVDKKSGKLLEKKIRKKLWYKKRDPATGYTIKAKVPVGKEEAETLNNDEIKTLWELGIKIEKHYNKPQDIEWCEQGGRIYIVQTRAITTLVTATKKGGREEIKGKVLLQGFGASPGIAKGRVRIIKDLKELDSLEPKEILVTKMTNPDMVPYMKKVCGIITDEGGKTCHAAIVSRELGIPCIVGTGKATDILVTGKTITMDAYTGKIYSGESKLEHKKSPELKTYKRTKTLVKVNLAFPDLPRLAERTKHADGVGLLRAEHMFLGRKHPVLMAKKNPEELIKVIKEGAGKIAKIFYPRPVWYRTLDARTDEFRRLSGGEKEPTEANPMLGWHGIRRSLDEPDVFRCEVTAIKMLHREGLDNISIMLPFVAKVEEFAKARKIIHSIFSDVPKLWGRLKIGIMVETPACALDIESFCKAGISFASVGSNDLTQLVLGVDRNNAKISGLYTELNPAVMGLIKKTIDTCRKYRIEVSLCGEAGSSPVMVEKLVKMGISSVSAEIDAIDEIRTVVAKAEEKQ